jgi:RNA polymerase sigma factor (sigma-70 family)
MEQAQSTTGVDTFSYPVAAPALHGVWSSDRDTGVADRVNTPTLDYANATSEELLAAARSSDQEAFARLSGRCVEMVRKKVFAILRNREDTDDIVQEALFKAYTHLADFRGSCTFSTWLTTIAINSALMLLRRRRSHFEVSLDLTGNDKAGAFWELPDPRLNVEGICAKRQTHDLVSHAISRLPAQYRGVLEQYHLQEKSLQEAADALEISVSAAKARLLRARVTLRSLLGKHRLAGTRTSLSDQTCQLRRPDQHRRSGLNMVPARRPRQLGIREVCESAR